MTNSYVYGKWWVSIIHGLRKVCCWSVETEIDLYLDYGFGGRE